MVLGQDWPEMHGSKQDVNPLKKIQGTLLCYVSQTKRIKSPKKVPSKSAKNEEKRPMVLDQDWPKMNGSKQDLNPLKIVQGTVLGYVSPTKRIKSPKKVPSKSVKIDPK